MFYQRIRGLISALLLAPVVAACVGRAAGPESGDIPARNIGSVLTAEEIENSRITVNTMQDLLLMMPGMTSTGRGVQITGLGGTPLFILNGVPLSDATAAMGLNPRDIERVEVVKSGGATALYGFRGTNGVILITTK